MAKQPREGAYIIWGDRELPFESCIGTQNIGITPAQIEIQIPPQPEKDIPFEGDLLMIDGDTTITFPHCIIADSGLQYDKSGMVVSLRLLDHRWKWRFGRISGQYNLRDDNGKIVKDREKNQQAQGDAIADTEKTPEELAKIFTEKMEDCSYVSTTKSSEPFTLPKKPRPYFDMQSEIPARMLQKLCDELGYCVVSRKFSEILGGVVLLLYRLGVGNKLRSDLPIESYSAEIDPPEKPARIAIEYGPSRYQWDFFLEAVALDVDGQIKLADKVSYAPAGGWEAAGFGPPQGVGLDAESKRHAYELSVGKWFRITTPHFIPGYDDNIERLRQILPIEEEQVTQKEVLGTKKNLPAWVYGVYAKEDQLPANTADDEKFAPPTDASDSRIVPLDQFTIDRERGIVKFGKQQFKHSAAGDTDNKPKFARLRLRCAVRIRDKKTGGWLNKTRERPIVERSKGKKNKKQSSVEIVRGAFTEFHRHEEITATFVTLPKKFDDNQGAKTTNNDSETNAEADHYLDSLIENYNVDRPETVTYVGLHQFLVDGAIRSVTWIIDGNGATTKVHRNNDPGSPTTLPYKIRRLNERAKAAADAADREKRYQDGKYVSFGKQV